MNKYPKYFPVTVSGGGGGDVTKEWVESYVANSILPISQTAQQAKQTAEQANETANTAEEEASIAKDASDNAVNKANAADTKADNAATIANNAQETADQAKQEVDTLSENVSDINDEIISMQQEITNNKLIISGVFINKIKNGSNVIIDVDSVTNTATISASGGGSSGATKVTVTVNGKNPVAYNVDGNGNININIPLTASMKSNLLLITSNTDGTTEMDASVSNQLAISNVSKQLSLSTAVTASLAKADSASQGINNTGTNLLVSTKDANNKQTINAPIASDNVAGLAQADGSSIVANNGVLSATSQPSASNGYQCYNFNGNYTVTVNPNVITSIKSVTVKRSFLSKTLNISFPMISYWFNAELYPNNRVLYGMSNLSGNTVTGGCSVYQGGITNGLTAIQTAQQQDNSIQIYLQSVSGGSPISISCTIQVADCASFNNLATAITNSVVKQGYLTFKCTYSITNNAFCYDILDPNYLIPKVGGSGRPLNVATGISRSNQESIIFNNQTVQYAVSGIPNITNGHIWHNIYSTADVGVYLQNGNGLILANIQNWLNTASPAMKLIVLTFTISGRISFSADISNCPDFNTFASFIQTTVRATTPATGGNLKAFTCKWTGTNFIMNNNNTNDMIMYPTNLVGSGFDAQLLLIPTSDATSAILQSTLSVTYEDDYVKCIVDVGNIVNGNIFSIFTLQNLVAISITAASYTNDIILDSLPIRNSANYVVDNGTKTYFCNSNQLLNLGVLTDSPNIYGLYTYKEVNNGNGLVILPIVLANYPRLSLTWNTIIQALYYEVIKPIANYQLKIIIDGRNSPYTINNTSYYEVILTITPSNAILNPINGNYSISTNVELQSRNGNILVIIDGIPIGLPTAGIQNISYSGGQSDLSLSLADSRIIGAVKGNPSGDQLVTIVETTDSLDEIALITVPAGNRYTVYVKSSISLTDGLQNNDALNVGIYNINNATDCQYVSVNPHDDFNMPIEFGYNHDQTFTLDTTPYTEDQQYRFVIFTSIPEVRRVLRKNKKSSMSGSAAIVNGMLNFVITRG